MQELINCSNTSSKVFNHVEQSNLNNYTQFCLTCYKNKIYLITYQLRSRNNVEKIDGQGLPILRTTSYSIIVHPLGSAQERNISILES